MRVKPMKTQLYPWNHRQTRNVENSRSSLLQGSTHHLVTKYQTVSPYSSSNEDSETTGFAEKQTVKYYAKLGNLGSKP